MYYRITTTKADNKGIIVRALACTRASMKRITRKNVKVDRVACAWLLTTFIEPKAEFLFVDEGELFQKAEQEQAIPFDAPRIPELKLNHRDAVCAFEAHAVTNPALHRLALIVRATDVEGQEAAATEGAGLRAIAHGFAAMGLSDEGRLARQFPIYDALYEYVQKELQGGPRP